MRPNQLFYPSTKRLSALCVVLQDLYVHFQPTSTFVSEENNGAISLNYICASLTLFSSLLSERLTSSHGWTDSRWHQVKSYILSGIYILNNQTHLISLPPSLFLLFLCVNRHSLFCFMFSSLYSWRKSINWRSSVCSLPVKLPGRLIGGITELER